MSEEKIAASVKKICAELSSIREQTECSVREICNELELIKKEQVLSQRTARDVLTEFYQFAQKFTVGDFSAGVLISNEEEGEPKLVIYLTDNAYEDYWEFELGKGEMIAHKERQQKRVQDQTSAIMMALADGGKHNEKYKSLFKEYKELLSKETNGRKS